MSILHAHRLLACRACSLKEQFRLLGKPEFSSGVVYVIEMAYRDFPMTPARSRTSEPRHGGRVQIAGFRHFRGAAE